MICSACGKTNADGVSFCEYCGANLRAQSATTPGMAAPSPVPAAQAPPSVAQVAQMSRSLLSTFTLGEKLAGAGTIAAVIGFFLPWVSTPDLGPLAPLLGQLGGAELTHFSANGVDLAKYVGAVYLYLVAAIAAGILLYFSSKAITSQRLLMAGFLVMIGSLCGPGVIAMLLFAPFIQSVAGAGLWLFGLGYCAIAAGGLIIIGSLSKSAR